MKDRMCKVWMIVFSSAAGIFLSFERLVSFIVDKHSALNSLLYKLQSFEASNRGQPVGVRWISGLI